MPEGAKVKPFIAGVLSGVRPPIPETWGETVCVLIFLEFENSLIFI